ncbi:hypothetical protein K493DRAFT_316277 [Basidiobolus meristosporus CBS 931.73]|uniref:Dihydrolipoamide acetyltransferase component of pyruvate dehydrogenase complex n=1 Tax=Basidiobolus meristosporus CBS 931.73 TaxID=1314790 RepID=A0A1Y1Y4M0_9FUNG|nr:hypothetical protein K493DRAFT_316277 [Basidiobolus meristosporus CBS 931.73]|eukprot:ORX92947.1 hypothetical protein K493DRAFT_316277 [Basidiobolus meristosporus CBS 931.73]
MFTIRSSVFRSLASTGVSRNALRRNLHQSSIRNATSKLLMPALSPTMTEGTITSWKKQEGDKLEAGEVILEIETDKAQMEIEAQDDGILAKILVPTGTKGVAVNSLIAILAEEGDDISSIEIPADAPAKSEPSASPEASPASSTPATPSTSEAPAGDRDNYLSPAVAHLVRNNKIEDINKVPATGPKGRILKGDVLSYLGIIKGGAPTPKVQESKPAQEASKPASVSSAAYEDIPVTTMRRVIASRLSESKSTVPHSYVARDIVVDEIAKLRRTLKENNQISVSVNDFIVRATSLALRDVPELNVRYNASKDAGESISSVDISIAVATPTGLITPIVKNADRRGLTDISKTVKELAAKARAGKLMPDEYQGGSFSISNLGMYGIGQFTAIINPPQACIMAVGGTKIEVIEDESAVEVPSEPVVESTVEPDVFDYLSGEAKFSYNAPVNGNLKTRQIMTVNLSIDERVVDAAIAGDFLNKFKFYMENPINMIL